MKKNTLNINISASVVGKHFDHACNRFMAYDMLTKPDLVGWGEKKNEHTASQDAGKIWEWEALKLLQDAGHSYYAEDKDGKPVKDIMSVTDKKEGFGDLSEETTIALFKDPFKYIMDLKSKKKGYVYQTTIRAGLEDGFLKEVVFHNEEYKDMLQSMFDDSDEFIHANWRSCKPDLIRVEVKDGKCIYSIIDMKHARRARMSHKVQVAIYVKLLETLFKDKNIPGVVNREAGYLWNFKKAEPKKFDLSVVMPFVDEFFDKLLPETLSKLRECCSSNESDIFNKTFAAMPTQMCEWCDNYDNCREWQKKNEPITLLPYLSSYAQKYLRETNIPLSLEGFRNHILIEENKKKLSEDCYSLKKVLQNADKILFALEKKLLSNESEHDLTAEINEQSSLAMPSWQDVCIILTAQRDEATDRMYALGIRASYNKPELDLFDTGFRETESGVKYAREYEKVFLAKSRDEIESCTRQFMECLYEVLKKCSDHNVPIDDDRNKILVQGYVMDNYELINIEEALLDELLNGLGAEDEEYREKLLSILYWIQGESMVTEVEEQSSYLGVDFPIIVITGAVNRLFSIPSFIAYDLETVSDALIRENHFEKIDYYCHRLSNTMKSDPINILWDNEAKDDDSFKGIKTHISIRLSTEARIVSEIQRKLKGSLRRRPDPFYLRAVSSNMDVRAAKLWIEYQYEELLKYHDMRGVRMNDLSQMADDGIIIRASQVREEPIRKNTYPGTRDGFRCTYRLENSEKYYQGEMFMGILLKVRDELAEDELARLSKNAEGGRFLPLSIMYPNEENVIARIYGIDNMKFRTDENHVTYVEFERFKGRDAEEEMFTVGSEFYIVERYKDQQGSKIKNALWIDSIASYEEEDANIRAYLYPEKWVGRMQDAGDYEKTLDCKPTDGGYDFTYSQKKAFKHLFENNITLLLGPPGTGKTDFIARAVITICKYYKTKRDMDISVLVSANSHSAINNILAKVREKMEGAEGEPALYKLDKWGDGSTDAIDDVLLARDYIEVPEEGVVYSGYAYAYRQDRPFIMGATSWQVLKSIDKYNDPRNHEEGSEFTGYDVVVIDEASQMLMSAALLPLQASLNESETRFLIVGDEDQLPPVLQGKYDTSEQPVDFYGSVFRAYYDSAREHNLDYIVPLEEQFRMNEILSRYPAEAIYDSDMEEGDGRKGYRPFNLQIGTQKLKLADESEDELIKAICDPEYPLIVCRIHDGGAMEKRDAEIGLTTNIVRYLRENMIDFSSDSRYAEGETGDKAFWGSSSGEGGMGIISPHHEQINRLRENIATQTGMSRDDIFIGTVDKLQGRQREAVIVSYGVTDPEKAADELEFIYSRNRLNVAMTRGKKKTICILSDTLLDLKSELLSVDDDKILKGINYMTGLLEFMKRTEDDTETDPIIDIKLGNVMIDIYRKRIK